MAEARRAAPESDSTTTALIKLAIAVTVPLIALLNGYIAYQTSETHEVAKQTHDLVNSRMSRILELTERFAEERGRLEERASEAERQSAPETPAAAKEKR